MNQLLVHQVDTRPSKNEDLCLLGSSEEYKMGNILDLTFREADVSDRVAFFGDTERSHGCGGWKGLDDKSEQLVRGR